MTRPQRITKCPYCDHQWKTRANGYSVTCLECDRPHYVSRADDPGDRLATRARRAVACKCGHAFTTRAKRQSATRCPGCRSMVLVRLDAPVVAPARTAPDRHPAPAPRTGPHRTRTAPAPTRPAPAPAPARTAPAPAPAPARTAPAPMTRTAPAPAPGLLTMLGAFLGQPAPAPAPHPHRPAPAPAPAPWARTGHPHRAPAPAPAPAPARTPTPSARTPTPPAPVPAAERWAPPARPAHRARAVAPVRPVSCLDRLGYRLAPADSRPGGLAGYCVLTSGQEDRAGRDCGAHREFYVGLPDGSVIYVCQGHRYALERAAVRERLALTVAPLH